MFELISGLAVFDVADATYKDVLAVKLLVAFVDHPIFPWSLR